MIILKWYIICSSVKSSWLGKLNESSMKRMTRYSKNWVNSLKCMGWNTSTKCSAMLIRPHVLWINLSSTSEEFTFVFFIGIRITANIYQFFKLVHQLYKRFSEEEMCQIFYNWMRREVSIFLASRLFPKQFYIKNP